MRLKYLYMKKYLYEKDAAPLRLELYVSRYLFVIILFLSLSLSPPIYVYAKCLIVLLAIRWSTPKRPIIDTRTVGLILTVCSPGTEFQHITDNNFKVFGWRLSVTYSPTRYQYEGDNWNYRTAINELSLSNLILISSYRLLEYSKNQSIIKDQDFFACISYISYTTNGNSMAWSWVRVNWDYMVER